MILAASLVASLCFSLGFFKGTPLCFVSTPAYACKVINIYPHDQGAFTQGLVFADGVIYEGTGLNGSSSLRKVELETGAILKMHKLPDQFFGEGITAYKDKIIQLTWRSHTGFIYHKDNFELIGEFKYPYEGWGITYDGKYLIISDGTAALHFLNPETFMEEKTVKVYEGNNLVTGLNELEYIQGEIYANVWQTERVVRINPKTGEVVGWINLRGLLGFCGRNKPPDVLNGIAYDSENGRLFVTGKLWPKLFEIKLIRTK